MFKPLVDNLATEEGRKQIEKVKELTKLAESGMSHYFSVT